MPIGFGWLVLRWLPAWIVQKAFVRFLLAREASSEPGMKIAAVLRSEFSLAVLAPTASCRRWCLSYCPSAEWVGSACGGVIVWASFLVGLLGAVAFTVRTVAFSPPVWAARWRLTQ